MTVTVTQPSINVREKLAELDKPSGVAGEAMLRAETPQEQFNLIGAGRRNLIINGAMVFSQRNGTSAVTLNSAGSVVYDFDRWRRQVFENGKLSLQQVTDAPSGFSYSIKATTVSAVAGSGSDYYMFNQLIEGFDTAHLAFGTSDAKTITLSFWVKSTLAGQWSGAIKNSASNRAYVFTYDIKSANTWEYKTITIPGDTSGTWVGSTNGLGLSLMYDLGTARGDLQGASNAWSSTNAYAATTGVRLVQNASATWQVTGVQLELGKVATPFEHRSYGEELALCQRYYYQAGGETTTQFLTTGQAWSTTQFNGCVIPFPVTMRDAPEMSYASAANFKVQNSAGSGITITSLSISTGEESARSANVRGSVGSGLVAGNATMFYTANTAGILKFDAEL